MARRRFFDEATLTQLREMPASDALALLAIHVTRCTNGSINTGEEQHQANRP